MATVSAVAGLWLLHFRSPIAKLVVWVLVIESLIDLGNATVGGIRENALETASGVTWLILSFYVPGLWVSTVAMPLTLGNVRQTVQECHGTAEGLEGDLSRQGTLVADRCHSH